MSVWQTPLWVPYVFSGLGFRDLPEPADGTFTMSEAPGLGFERNRDAIREIAKLPLSEGRGKG